MFHECVSCVGMLVCKHVYVHACVHVYGVHAHLALAHVCVCERACMRVRVYVCVFACLRVSVCELMCGCRPT